MNSYNNGRTTPVISLQQGQHRDDNDDTQSNVPGVLDKIEAIVVATRQLEAALHSERAKSRRLRDELQTSHFSYEKLIKDLESKNNELSASENRLKAALGLQQETEKRLQYQLNTLSSEFKKLQLELNQYRAAWSQVLQREREAKLIIRESEKTHQKLAETDLQCKSLSENLTTERAKREQIERHSKSYQLELQNALVRLHSAEAKFSELSKELEIAHGSKKKMDEEVAKVERSIKERYQWELVKEREAMKAESEKRIALEREQWRDKLREELQAKSKIETDKLLEDERKKSDQRRQEMQIEIHALEQALAKANQDVFRAKAEVSASKIIQRESQVSAPESLVKDFEFKLAQEKKRTREATMSAERKIDEIIISERKRTSEMVEKLRSKKNLDGTNDEVALLETALLSESERAKSLESALIAEKVRFDEMAQLLYCEVERLQTIYPLRDLLTAKTEEIGKVTEQLESLSAHSIERIKAENFLKNLQEQSNRLGKMLKESENRMEAQLRRIKRCTEINTFLAEAGDVEFDNLTV